MKDIKELIRGILDAELVEQKGEIEGLTLRQMNSVNAIAWNVATRLIAAYLAEQEPLHVGDSQFESWFSTYWSASLRNGSKQIARDAYAAGMGDPLVVPAACAAPSSEEVREMVESVDHILTTATTVEGYKAGVQILRLMIKRLAALMKERDEWRNKCAEHVELTPVERWAVDQLAAAQARESKLRGLIPAFRPEFGAVGSRDVDVAQQQKAFDEALALPTDDSALMARLKGERAKVLQEIQDAKN